MKKNITVSLFVAAMVAMPLQVQAQGILGKLLKKVEKVLNVEVLANEQTSENEQNVANVEDNGKPRYEIHETSATKKITIRGGAQELCPFSNGRALVKTNKGWMVINKSGEIVFNLPEGYEPIASTYDNGRLMVKQNTNSIYYINAAILDVDGNIIKNFEKLHDASGFMDGVAIIKVDENGEWVNYHIDTDGNILSKTLPANEGMLGGYKLYHLREGLRPFYDKKVERWGFSDAQCNIVIKPQFKNGGGFFEGLAPVKNEEDLWGYIDRTGNYVIEPMYTNVPGAFHAGRALVKDKAEARYYIDRTGNFVWSEGSRDYYSEYKDYMSTGYAVWVLDRDAYLVNSDFKVVAQYSGIDRSGEIVSYTDKWFEWYTSWNYMHRLYDYQGHLLLEFEISGGSFSEGVSCRNGYYFNDKGEILVRFYDTQF